MSDLFGGSLPEMRRPSAAVLRDEAIDRVIRGAGGWYDKAIVVLAGLPRGWEGIGEDMRHIVERRLGRPVNRNVMGALVRELLKLRVFMRTGRFRQMGDPQSHARESRIHVRV